MKDYPFNPDKVFHTDHGMNDDALYYKYIVVCPICGNEFVHIGIPVVENGEDNYQSSASEYRGNLTRMPFECEGKGGHKFEICFGFHKGNAFTFFRDPGQQEDLQTV